ncbi:hypothetical protein CONLIGDRAFT_647174 [Coniochaeta ligniaria NRRL 30616]|uniref:Uncharacterized protein n=1 Tax=Coniochaeta ligniaria NRRL 30616 TaxID=1408157 RepID=A0A1J7IH54_9PEZI|nr:hypothetical protein CONLIGDRAFT_647174 [Coniochaeta ligniaria NRRL 30616]
MVPRSLCVDYNAGTNNLGLQYRHAIPGSSNVGQPPIYGTCNATFGSDHDDLQDSQRRMRTLRPGLEAVVLTEQRRAPSTTQNPDHLKPDDTVAWVSSQTGVDTRKASARQAHQLKMFLDVPDGVAKTYRDVDPPTGATVETSVTEDDLAAVANSKRSKVKAQESVQKAGKSTPTPTPTPTPAAIPASLRAMRGSGITFPGGYRSWMGRPRRGSGFS